MFSFNRYSAYWQLSLVSMGQIAIDSTESWGAPAHVHEKNFPVIPYTLKSEAPGPYTPTGLLGTCSLLCVVVSLGVPCDWIVATICCVAQLGEI